MNAKHSSKSNEWYSPEWLVTTGKKVLGRIDLDPASCAEANKVIEATDFFSADQRDALTTDWYGYMRSFGKIPTTVWLNPPGGGLATKFWERLMFFRAAQGLRHAIFVGFSQAILRTSQKLPDYCYPVGEFYCCFPKKRIAFTPGPGMKSTSPTHDNVIIYVPGTQDAGQEFINIFQDIGTITCGKMTKHRP